MDYTVKTDTHTANKQCNNNNNTKRTVTNVSMTLNSYFQSSQYMFIQQTGHNNLLYFIKHMHTILTAIIPGEPGLVGCPIDFPSLFLNFASFWTQTYTWLIPYKILSYTMPLIHSPFSTLKQIVGHQE